VLAVFWPQLSTYYNCMGGANTVTAQQACHKQFTDSVGSEISLLQNGRLQPSFLIAKLIRLAWRIRVIRECCLACVGHRPSGNGRV
jgi:hypothetical protein